MCRSEILAAAAFGLVASSCPGAEIRAVTENATPQARQILAYLYHIKKAGKILSGQHVYLSGDYDETRHVHALTGAYPAIAEFDLLGFHNNPSKRKKYLAFARQWHASGGLVGISWHESSPALGSLDTGGYSQGTKKRMNQQDFNRVITPGTDLHRKWLGHVDAAAAWLGELQKAGIPVLWRPYHEMTGGWFWWGAKSPDSFCQLWINLFKRLTEHHGLNNLLWVWSAAQRGDDYRDYFPMDYVDIGGQDMYRTQRNDPEFVKRYGLVARAAGTKPVALTEVGMIPFPDILIGETEFVWFEIWGRGFLDSEHYGPPRDKAGNAPKDVIELYKHPAVITRNEIKLEKAGD